MILNLLTSWYFSYHVIYIHIPPGQAPRHENSTVWAPGIDLYALAVPGLVKRRPSRPGPERYRVVTCTDGAVEGRPDLSTDRTGGSANSSPSLSDCGSPWFLPVWYSPNDGRSNSSRWRSGGAEASVTARARSLRAPTSRSFPRDAQHSACKFSAAAQPDASPNDWDTSPASLNRFRHNSNAPIEFSSSGRDSCA